MAGSALPSGLSAARQRLIAERERTQEQFDIAYNAGAELFSLMSNRFYIRPLEMQHYIKYHGRVDTQTAMFVLDKLVDDGKAELEILAGGYRSPSSTTSLSGTS